MEMKYYNASNNFSAPIPREPKPYRPPMPQKTEERVAERTVIVPEQIEESEEILCEAEEVAPVLCDKPQNTFAQDDYLLLGLILLLLASGCDDYLLLLALGYLLIAGKKKG